MNPPSTRVNLDKPSNLHQLTYHSGTIVEIPVASFCIRFAASHWQTPYGTAASAAKLCVTSAICGLRKMICLSFLCLWLAATRYSQLVHTTKHISRPNHRHHRPPTKNALDSPGFTTLIQLGKIQHVATCDRSLE